MILKNWNNKTTLSKVLTIIGFIISIAIIILALLQIFDVWRNAIYVHEPLLGVLMLIQASENWKENKSVAYFSLFTAIFIFAVAIFTFLILK